MRKLEKSKYISKKLISLKHSVRSQITRLKLQNVSRYPYFYPKKTPQKGREYGISSQTGIILKHISSKLQKVGLKRSDSYIAQLTRRTRTAGFTISEVAVDWQ